MSDANDTSQPTSQRAFQNEDVKIATLVGTDGMLEGATFENCRILGPAILGLVDDTEFRDSGFGMAGTVDSILWEIPNGKKVVGVIGLRHCKFIGCQFESIGLAGPPELMRQWRRQLGGAR